MRVLLKSAHRFPAAVGGGASCRVLDNLAKGLGELGHEVLYCLADGAAVAPPAGVEVVRAPRWDVDVMHLDGDQEVIEEAERRRMPWIATSHVDLQTWGMDRDAAHPNWIYVSRTLARLHGSERYVWNGVDPGELLYREEKEGYVLFVVSMLERARAKGLDRALALCQRAGVELVVAGASRRRDLRQTWAARCRDAGARFVGEVYGVEKARLFAGARALLFPTRMNEAFGLVIAEALVSGTPVIASDRGACPEIVTPDVGFVCATDQAFDQALAGIGAIAPAACRAKAMRDFHYLTMARGYQRELERQIEQTRTGPAVPAR